MRVSSDAISRAVFVLSLAVLAFLYGFTTRAAGWFPNDVLETAWEQLQGAPSVPSYVEVKAHDRSGARSVRPDRMQPGLTFVSSMWRDDADSSWAPGFTLLDDDGNTVHRWRFSRSDADIDPGSPDPPPGWSRYPLGSLLFPNGDVVFNLWGITVRADACGRVLWKTAAGGHHAVSQADDGSFWIPGRTSSPDDSLRLEGLPGLGSPSAQNYLLHLSPEGEVLEKINVLEVLYENDLQRLIVKKDLDRSSDITHLNDVEPLRDSLADEYPLFDAGDLLISLRDIELILVLDPRSRRVKWSAFRPFIGQHDPDFLGGGWIGVFDNNVDDTFRGSLLGGSRIVAVQPHTDSVEIRYPTPASERLFSNFGGNWQQLANGNMLLTETTAGRVLEVGPGGETVWEWVHEPYDAIHVPEVYRASRHDLTPGDVEAWPCAGESPERGREGNWGP